MHPSKRSSRKKVVRRAESSRKMRRQRNIIGLFFGNWNRPHERPEKLSQDIVSVVQGPLRYRPGYFLQRIAKNIPSTDHPRLRRRWRRRRWRFERLPRSFADDQRRRRLVGPTVQRAAGDRSCSGDETREWRQPVPRFLGLGNSGWQKSGPAALFRPARIGRSLQPVLKQALNYCCPCLLNDST